MDREAWNAAIQGIAKNWTRLSDRTELTHRKTITTAWSLQPQKRETYQERKLINNICFTAVTEKKNPAEKYMNSFPSISEKR